MYLSDKELLLLDCFMYSDIVPNRNGRTINDIFNAYSKNGEPLTAADLEKVQFSGDMDAEKMADVINQMHNDPKMNSLKIDGVTPEYKGSIRGACFVDENGNATVAFRGTGGSFDQWYGNTEAYGDVSNDSQRAAADFINSLPYKDIEVTGHSNGANMAMFVTIVCGNKIKKCKSFEGEGFSKEFLRKYKKEIAKNKHKIEQTSAYNDPIHRIMKRIAEKENYVNGGEGPFSHGCYNMIKNNKFDENGNFSNDSYRDESNLWSWVDFTDELAELSDVPIIGSTLEYVADFLGVLVAVGFDRKDIESWKKGLEKLLESYADYKINLIIDTINILDKIYNGVENVLKKLKEWLFKNSAGYKYAVQNTYIEININNMRAYARRLQQVSSRAKSLDRRMNSLYVSVGVDVFSFSKTMSNIGRILTANLVLEHSYKLDKCVSYLNETASDFDRTENQIIKQF